jgi:predicted O-methyltransferase YrrM
MYDFYFGNDQEIAADEEKYLISIKRMLPKWMNSIPDSEFLALNRLASTIEKDKPVFVETGLGASTLTLLFNVIKNNGVLYSWDTNSEKASQIRIACSETICQYFKCNIGDHWKVISSFSTSPYAGLSILSELDLKVDLFFHDSEHVLDVILGELEAVHSRLSEGALVCMDDANYDFKHTNTAFLNIIRKKLSPKLPPIGELDNNKSSVFYVEVENFLKEKFSKVEKLKDTYKDEYADDLFFKYFNNELQIKSSLKMEKLDQLEHRFDAWRVG